VNGRAVGRLAATEDFREQRQHIPAVFWRREINDVVLEPAGGRVLVGPVQFLRAGATPGEERGARER
jgi:hypothetical protein